MTHKDWIPLMALVVFAIGGCGSATQMPESRSDVCVDIPQAEYFQVINGRFVPVVTLDDELVEAPPITAKRIGATLEGMGYPWVALDWDGRVATVRGLAPDKLTRSDAFIAAKAAFEADPIAGDLVERVVNEIEVAETAEQVANRLTEVVQTVGFPWLSVTIEGEVARLTGDAPDAENKAAAYLAAKAIINADGSANDMIRLVRDETSIASDE